MRHQSLFHQWLIAVVVVFVVLSITTTTTTTNVVYSQSIPTPQQIQVIKIRNDIDCRNNYCNYFDTSLWQGGVVPVGDSVIASIDFSENSVASGNQRIWVQNPLTIYAVNVSAASLQQQYTNAVILTASQLNITDTLTLGDNTEIGLVPPVSSVGSLYIGQNSTVSLGKGTQLFVLSNLYALESSWILLNSATITVNGNATLKGSVGIYSTSTMRLGESAVISGTMDSSGDLYLASYTVFERGNTSIGGIMTVGQHQLSINAGAWISIFGDIHIPQFSSVTIQSHGTLAIFCQTVQANLHSITSQPNSNLYISASTSSTLTNIQLLGTTTTTHRPVSFFNGTISNLLIHSMESHFISLQNIVVWNISNPTTKVLFRYSLITDEYVEIANAAIDNVALVTAPYSTLNLTNANIRLGRFSWMTQSFSSIVLIDNATLRVPNWWSGENAMTNVTSSYIECRSLSTSDAQININGQLVFNGSIYLFNSKLTLQNDSLLMVIKGSIIGKKQSRLHISVDRMHDFTSPLSAPVRVDSLFLFDSGSGIHLETLDGNSTVIPQLPYYLVSGPDTVNINTYACKFTPDNLYLYSFTFTNSNNGSNIHIEFNIL
ncbi:hypothetical protein DFA_09252 [Cavenderia fasciculata]|uniref:Transmembrane protein n=1 Tax=Cavenderia fasciculata TaxID=261658 RepID=F4Q740_CACFS|nr:uncharacterized protein DFA_09252 [Cavenderia fasciculata]EGG16222.1 hypothetical protein DFA_09252 [Cavenderia fasciculata]|eukprot:XP_004354606.1 hypothetical protein DFA_09252 [Cavenderia fasciculata]